MAAIAQLPPIEQMTPEQFMAAMADPMFRLCNLYYIKTKSPEAKEEDEDDDSTSVVVRFKPNRAQRKLLKRLHYRNIILKARQLGFTTLIQILFLDFAMFTPNINCGVIAHTDDSAKRIFRKIKFAYERLPDVLKAANPLVSCNASEMVFSNGSTITVATSMRGDTIHYLHVSEMGKIAAKFPHRAEEVVTGTIPAVPNDGMIFIESTAEGREGVFFKMSTRAEALALSGKKLTPKEYRFHFFPWHEATEYAMDPAGVIITAKDHEYFDALEGVLKKKITPEQRAWWISTRDNDFAGQEERMWQEYPSTPAEAFQQSTEGTYFKVQLAQARKEKRITTIPLLPNIPCFTFWDIGNSDGTAIWVIQRLGTEWRCVRFYEAWGEPYSHAVRWLQSLGVTWDTMFLPHDAGHERQGKTSNKSPRQMLEELMPGVRFEIVPVIDDVNWGIQQTRDVFPMLWFDEEHCKEGLAHIENYRKKWNEKQAVWSDKPDKSGGHSEAADALRQFAQAYTAGLINVSRGPSVSQVRKGKSRSWRVV